MLIQQDSRNRMVVPLAHMHCRANSGRPVCDRDPIPDMLCGSIHSVDVMMECGSRNTGYLTQNITV